MTDGEPKTAVSASLQNIKSIKSQHYLFIFHFFNFIKSQTNDSFVNHFDSHFAYLKTLDFSFKSETRLARDEKSGLPNISSFATGAAHRIDCT